MTSARHSNSTLQSVAAMLSALAVALAGTSGAATGATKSSTPELVSAAKVPSDPTRLLPTRLGVQVKRSRVVALSLDMLRIHASQTLAPDADRSLRLSVFEDAPLTITINRTERTYSGGVAYIGSVPELAYGTAVLVDNGGQVSFQISGGGKRYSVEGSADGGYVAKELAPILWPDHPRDPIEIVPTAGKKSQRPSASSLESPRAFASSIAADSGASIDVMVVYSPALRFQMGSTAAMQAAIDAEIAITNQAYADSNVVQRIRLVYRGEIDFVESYPDTDLVRLTTLADGYLDEVPILRDIYRADIVSLWGNYSYNYCGVGYLMASEDPSFESYAYSVVNAPSCIGAGASTFAHELGHNMGLRHDDYVDKLPTAVTPSTGGILTSVNYAHGYVDVANRFRTIMSYNDQCLNTIGNAAPTFGCVRIPRFSNPLLSFNNNPPYAGATSAPTGSAIIAHEQRALDDTRETVANFRQALASTNGPGIVLIAKGSTTVSESAGSVSLRVSRHAGSIGAISVNWSTQNGSATSGADFTGGSGTLMWADGDASDKTITIPILPDAISEGRETFYVTLGQAMGGASIFSVAGTSQTVTVVILDDEPDVFPAGCLFPAEMINQSGGANLGWIPATDRSSTGNCSLRSGYIANGQKAQFSATGNFQAGKVSFSYFVSTEAGWDCFRFLVNGAEQSIGGSCANVGGLGNSGVVNDWIPVTVQIPVAGAYTFTWSYEKDVSNSANNDAVWVDDVVLPLRASSLLTVSKPGDGSGTVSGTGINCGADCTEAVPLGTVVTLTATADAGSRFFGWTGGLCTGTGPCTLTLDYDKSVRAVFVLPDSFPADCQFPAGYLNIPQGSQAGWEVAVDRQRTGACSLKTSNVTYGGRSQVSVTDYFNPGTVSFYYDVANEDCCNYFAFYINGIQQNINVPVYGNISAWTLVTFPIAVAGEYTFMWSYSRNSNGTGTNAAWIDDVMLPPSPPPTLTVDRIGDGSGTVTGQGTDCGVDCTETFARGDILTLTAIASPGSTFAGWSGGGCIGTAPCTFRINVRTKITAIFVLPDAFPVGCVMPAGFAKAPTANAGWQVGTDRKRSGFCSLKSSPIGDSQKAQVSFTSFFSPGTISYYYNVQSEGCCDSHRFYINGIPQSITTQSSGEVTNWTLVSAPITTAGTYTLTWSYEKDGSVAIGSDAVWIDDLTLPPRPNYTLSVAKTGNGGGTVSGQGIDCGIDCSESVLSGTTVSLSATPQTGSVFTGWLGGGCSGISLCNAGVNMDTLVLATFTLEKYPLNVIVAGSGTGTVVSTGPGINCGFDCSEPIDYGQAITLIATPSVGSRFVGWTGADCATGTCTVTLFQVINVVATFELLPVAPAAPNLLTLTPGDAQITAIFAPPLTDGGSVIIDYTVQCVAPMNVNRTATSTMSPLTVTGLTNGVGYVCSVNARNAVASGAVSNPLVATPTQNPAIGLVSAWSRKLHGGVLRSLPIALGVPIGGAISIEPRNALIHEIAFVFNSPVAAAGSVFVLDRLNNLVSSAQTTVSNVGNEVRVVLTGVPDGSRVRLLLSGVNTSLSVDLTMGFLIGDVTETGRVSAADVSVIKALLGTLATTDVLSRFDLSLSGQIGSEDISIVKAHSGRSMQ